MSTTKDLMARLGNMLFRAVVRHVGDGGLIQDLQVEGRADELRGGVHHMLPYGLSTAVPTDGTAETLVLAVDRGHLAALPATVRRSRVRGMAAGEVALNTIHDDPKAAPREAGHRLHLFDDGGQRTAVLCADVAEVRCGATVLRLDETGVTITGAVTVNGTLHATGDITSAGAIIDTAGNTNHHSH